jgi:putative oxidoreductase
LQRLFSMFPNGWPGRALLLLRLVGGVILVGHGIMVLLAQNGLDVIAQQSLAITAGLFLIIGLWTPITGLVIVIVEVWSGFSGVEHLHSAVLLGTLGAALAMLGPGVRSIDARLFGRKRIDIPDR